MSEVVITYDGAPTYSVSIMEFADEHVVHETQYFADPSARLPGGPHSPSRRPAGRSPDPWPAAA